MKDLSWDASLQLFLEFFHGERRINNGYGSRVQPPDPINWIIVEYPLEDHISMIQGVPVRINLASSKQPWQ